jgi:hypothetical protein
MRRLFNNIYSFVSVMLLMIFGVGAFAPAGHTLAAKKKNKEGVKLSIPQRLEKTAAKVPGESPILPIMMHAVERMLNGSLAETDIDKGVRAAFARHPRVTKEMMRQAVANYKAMPETLKRKLIPAELRNLPAVQRFDMKTLEPVLQRFARAKSQVANKPNMDKSLGWDLDYTKLPKIDVTLPWIRNVFGSPGDNNKPQTDFDGTPLLNRGKGFMLDALNISPELAAQKNLIRIQFIKTVHENLEKPTHKVVTAVSPKIVTLSPNKTATMIIDTPPRLAPGFYQVQIVTAEKGRGNMKWVNVDAKKLRLNGTDVAARYPGSKFLLNGQFPFADIDVLLERTDEEGFPIFLISHMSPESAKPIGNAQAEVTVPQWLLPGKYRIAYKKSDDSVMSNWVDFTVRAPLYRVQFTKIKCLDESDPEVDGDEPYTMWGGSADPNFVWTKSTGQYTDFGDGVELAFKPQHQWILMPNGNNLPIHKYLAVSTTLWEWDVDDAQTAKELLDAIGDAAAAIGTAIGGTYGPIIGEIANIVFDLIGFIVELFGGEPDFLGTKTLAWTAADLQILTAGKQQTPGKLEFMNSDDDGSYRLSYIIHREQPN